jgi:hypothetical protein
MSKKQPTYYSYLMRLWRDNGSDSHHPVDVPTHQTGGSPVWRASVESARTGKRQNFASLDALFAFLRRQTGLASGAPDAQDKAKG